MHEPLPGQHPNQSHWRVSLGLTLLYAALGVPAAIAHRNGLATLPVWPILQALVLAVPLIAMSVVDLRSFRLPDALTLPLLILGLARTRLEDPTAQLDHGIAAVLGYTLLASLAYVYMRLRNRRGLGLGDAKLMAASGAWLGTDGLLSSLLLASFSALAFVLLGPRDGQPLSGQTKIAFGPFLALGIWLTWLYGPLI